MEIWNTSNYIRDLKYLSEIIDEFEIKGDFRGIGAVIESIESNDKNLIDYRLSGFSLHLKGAIAGSIPPDLHFCKIDLENRFALKDDIYAEIDPLFKYTLDLKISLFKSENNQNKEYCSTWHLDKEDGGHDFSYIHPYYHLQFGGKKHEYLDSEMAILGSPRIPHPPMDIILAFHFILNNFIDRKIFSYVDAILNDYRYIRILKNSTKRLWEPYFNGYLNSSSHEDYKISKLFPLYIN
ncbi:hypothetical protein [Labilibaculum euxinus]